MLKFVLKPIYCEQCNFNIIFRFLKVKREVHPFEAETAATAESTNVWLGPKKYV